VEIEGSLRSHGCRGISLLFLDTARPAAAVAAACDIAEDSIVAPSLNGAFLTERVGVIGSFGGALLPAVLDRIGGGGDASPVQIQTSPPALLVEVADAVAAHRPDVVLSAGRFGRLLSIVQLDNDVHLLGLSDAWSFTGNVNNQSGVTGGAAGSVVSRSYHKLWETYARCGRSGGSQ